MSQDQRAEHRAGPGDAKLRQIPEMNAGTPLPEEVYCLCGESTRKEESSIYGAPTTYQA